MTTDERDFLARWSRRKQAAREGLAEPEPEAPAEPGEVQAAAPESAETAGEDAFAEDAFADVDFDALDYASDYTRFMGKGVPDIIQRQALRALWRSDPILANVDGLNDYDEDFTDAARAVKALATVYKPGQGYRTDDEMAALEAEEKAEAQAREAAREAGSDETRTAQTSEPAQAAASDDAASERRADAEATPSDAPAPDSDDGPASHA